MARSWSRAPGLEDTLHLGRGRLAKGNGPLVQRAVAIAANLDLPIASAADAEAGLKLSPGH
jgi:3-keto-5-aminohexanoate cleavage enzyme